MPNQFDITPLDPMGAANQWQQDLAHTSILQSTATLDRDKAMEYHQEMIASQAFRDRVKQMDPAMDPLKRLSLAASYAMDVGDITDAEKVLQTMVHVTQLSALQDYRAAQADAAHATAETKRLQFWKNVGPAIHDAEGKEMADALYERTFPGEKSPQRDNPYTPAWNKFINETSISAADRAEIGLREATAKREAAQTHRLELLEKADADYAREKARLEKKRADEFEKAAGKGAVASKEDKAGVKETIKAEYGEAAASPEAVQDIAQEAKMMATREKIDLATATRAILNRKDVRERFKLEERGGPIGSMLGAFGAGKQFKYRGSDLPLPPTADPSLLIPGRVYAKGGARKRFVSLDDDGKAIWEDVK